MLRWDEDETVVLAAAVRKAIKRDDIQAALYMATFDSRTKKATVTAALENNAKIDEILAAVPAEASTYRQIVKAGRKELRTYLLTNYDEYRVICDLEDETIRLARQKMLELDQLKAQRIRVKAQEQLRTLQTSMEEKEQGAARSRATLFRRRNIVRSTTETVQLCYNYQALEAELTRMRRIVSY